jgi:hypothetical protein
MVELFPVRAWHPDPGRVNPDSVVCPVYDTVSDADWVRYSSQPYNAARFVPRPHGMALEKFLLASVGHLGEALRISPRRSTRNTVDPNTFSSGS